MMKNKYTKFMLVIIIFSFISFYFKDEISNCLDNLMPESYAKENTITINENSGEDYLIINNNEPLFNEEDKTTYAFEKYSKFDSLGRAREAYANINIDLMPTTKRESIGMIKPTGWHTIKYDIVPGKYLYNRCHLIGYQLTGQNANPNNLITCTRETNSKTMLEFENKVANYIKETGNHVMYRVTPKFYGDNLVASGIEMEAKSVEDNGAGLKFHVYVYNVETGIDIDYKTGKSSLSN